MSRFEEAAKKAVKNIIKHGDTDIFPYSFERHAFFDREKQLVELIKEYETNFDGYLVRLPPQNVNALTPVSYFGFRWATQIDPIWNAHFLATVICIAQEIEDTRIPKADNYVFSYRFKYDRETGDLFDRDYGWRQFMAKSLELAEEYQFVVTCDISEFYPRLGHHRLENALKQIVGQTSYPKRIMDFLSNFTNTKSFGLPIGGPASRILSELTINQIDRLLRGAGIRFTRFSDDFHIFAKTREEAYNSIIYLSEKLFDNQGLALQKSKTRLMSAAEFKATNQIAAEDQDSEADADGKAVTDQQNVARRLLSFSLRFDPYSPTAEEDYEKLKDEIRQFDILGLLKEELTKSRVHVALSRKLLAAIRYLDSQARDDAVLSIVDNHDVLYPIFSSALLLIDAIFGDLSAETQTAVVSKLVGLISAGSHIFRVDVNLCFALRVLRHRHTPETQELLQQLHATRTSQIVRRDIILIMAEWGEWYWLSDLRNQFRSLSPPERRAFIVASYALTDEGRHWRQHTDQEFSPFEKFIHEWAKERAGTGKTGFPL